MLHADLGTRLPFLMICDMPQCPDLVTSCDSTCALITVVFIGTLFLPSLLTQGPVSEQTGQQGVTMSQTRRFSTFSAEPQVSVESEEEVRCLSSVRHLHCIARSALLRLQCTQQECSRQSLPYQLSCDAAPNSLACCPDMIPALTLDTCRARVAAAAAAPAAAAWDNSSSMSRQLHDTTSWRWKSTVRTQAQQQQQQQTAFLAVGCCSLSISAIPVT